MMRWIGCVMMMISGAGLGFYYSARFGRRVALLTGLYQMVNLLKGEISYGSRPLPEAFLGMKGKLKAPISDFACCVALEAQRRQGKPFAEIFSCAVQKVFKDSALKESDLEALSDLGNHLGYLDRQMQLRVLDFYGHNLQDCIQELRRELPSQKKVCQSLGVMGGVFLAILLA